MSDFTLLPNGMKLPSHKQASTTRPIATAALPAQLQLALAGSQCCVEPGQRVLKYQLLARPDNALGLAVHAPTSGHIHAIAPYPQALPGTPLQTALLLHSDGQDEAQPLAPPPDGAGQSRLELAIFLQNMGVAGQHGPLLPLSWAASDAPLELLIINGMESEPYISADDMLMREQASELVAAIQLLQQRLRPTRLVLAVRHDKPAAISALRTAAAGQTWQIEVREAPYPADDAPLLTRLLGGTAETTLCLPVAGVHAAGQAMRHGLPCISRIVTLSGAVEHAQNIRALLGSPARELLALATPHPYSAGIIHGGGLRGFTLADDSVAIHQHSNGLLAAAPRPSSSVAAAQPCVRCGDCATICPSQLQPQELYWHCQTQDLMQAQDWGLTDCSQCGLCSAVCPSQLPLLDSFRNSSLQLQADQQQQQAADSARQRHHFRQFRQERDKQEKAQRLAERAAQQAAKLAQTPSAHPASAAKPEPSAADKQAAIAAAMARASQRQQHHQGQTATAATAEQDARAAAIAANRQAAIDAAMARAAARKAAQDAAKAGADSSPSAAGPTPAPEPAPDKQELIRTSMARAAAQKAAQAAPPAPTTMDDDKKALIAAAMARAAARKAERDDGEQET